MVKKIIGVTGNPFVADKAYKNWLGSLKQRFKNSQIQAAIRINSSMLEFYWSLAQDLVKMKVEEKWGAGVIEQISLDLKAEFPTAKGFSARNLWKVKQWFLFYNEKLHQVGGVNESSEKLLQVVAEIDDKGKLPQVGAEFGEKKKLHQVGAEFKMPEKFALVPWRHHTEIISKCKSIEEALFYIDKTIENSWSRAVLIHQMELGLFKRLGKSVNNFDLTLPKSQSVDVNGILKESYTLDFLPVSEELKERDLENGLEQNIMRFLLELGKGFAYVGRQVELNVEGDSFFADMLFYHIRLKRYVVVELKTTDFEPGFAGQLGFYVTAVDKLLKNADDQPSIGLLICKSKKKTVVEWSLSNVLKPIGVAEYKFLPKAEELKKQLEMMD